MSDDLNRDDESMKTAKKADKAGATICNCCHSLLVCEAITKIAVGVAARDDNDDLEEVDK